MDSAEDGLTEISESTEEADDAPCALRVEALELVM